MSFFLKIVKEFPSYLWSGWGALASVFLFIACWDVGAQLYGDLALPSPLQTLVRLGEILQDPKPVSQIWITIQRASYGFLISVAIGTILGLVSGFFATASVMSRPIVTILMGMPPIAWIVLAMIWFGMTDQTIIFTIVTASVPIVFVGALQGTRTIEGEMNEMCDSFKLPFFQKFTDLYAPHIFSYIFPAWVAALGMSWKIVVMAELLASNDGVGAMLAVSRAQLDTGTTMALIVVMIVTVMMVEYLLLEPMKREVESWRE